MRQADIFLESEGNAWFERNRDRLGQFDPVSFMIEDMGLQPSNVLEIGCANGWRLAKLCDKYDCNVIGIDPSAQAAIDALDKFVTVVTGTATDQLAIWDKFELVAFDVVIFGFCLYLTDPSDWLRIAAETDRILKDGGHIIIHDFADVFSPYARRYKHHAKILSYHFDFAKLWLAHPLYTVIRREIDHGEMVTVLRKRSADNFEVRP